MYKTGYSYHMAHVSSSEFAFISANAWKEEEKKTRELTIRVDKLDYKRKKG